MGQAARAARLEPRRQQPAPLHGGRPARRPRGARAERRQRRRLSAARRGDRPPLRRDAGHDRDGAGHLRRQLPRLRRAGAGRRRRAGGAAGLRPADGSRRRYSARASPASTGASRTATASIPTRSARPSRRARASSSSPTCTIRPASWRRTRISTRSAASRSGVGARVLVDEVYLDTACAGPRRPAAARSPVFVTTSSLTKSYGLSGLRCGWVIASPDVAERVRRARDVVDGSGAFPAEHLSVLAFSQLDRLAARAQRHPRAEPADGSSSSSRRGRSSSASRRPAAPSSSRACAAWTMRRPSSIALRATTTPASCPGSFFQAPAHVRIAFGGKREVLEEGLARIGRALDA